MTTPWTVQPIVGARDVKRAVSYYTEVLGFECRSFYEGGGDEGGVYALLQREGAGLHVQIRRRPLFPEGRNRIEADLYFYVPDADALHAELKARGARILRPVEDGPNYGMRDFVVEDLDGNRILFGSDKARGAR
jgi:predicted enzyme related to lactoylglutathione lyase